MQQQHPRRRDLRAHEFQFRATAAFPCLGREAGEQRNDRARALEHTAIATFEVAFRRQPLGQQYIVTAQFDMEILD